MKTQLHVNAHGQTKKHKNLLKTNKNKTPINKNS